MEVRNDLVKVLNDLFAFEMEVDKTFGESETNPTEKAEKVGHLEERLKELSGITERLINIVKTVDPEETVGIHAEKTSLPDGREVMQFHLSEESKGKEMKIYELAVDVLQTTLNPSGGLGIEVVGQYVRLKDRTLEQ